jgi:hypothetical protein
MGGVAEYLAKAIRLDALAACARDPLLKKRYADLARCYRLLAEERKRLNGGERLEARGSAPAQ